MRGLAYLLVVVIPLCAVGTVALAMRRGRPRPYATWSTSQILDQLTAIGAADSTERRRLREELFRRGRLH